MNKLTDRQQTIIDTLVKEFTAINKVETTSDNIFAHLCEKAEVDKRRIAEIVASNHACRQTIEAKIQADLDKYVPMFTELGLELRKPYSNSHRYELCTTEGKKVMCHQGYNKLCFEYTETRTEEYILGKWVKIVKGVVIKFDMSSSDVGYSCIEDMFKKESFQSYMKELIAMV